MEYFRCITFTVGVKSFDKMSVTIRSVPLKSNGAMPLIRLGRQNRKSDVKIRVVYYKHYIIHLRVISYSFAAGKDTRSKVIIILKIVRPAARCIITVANADTKKPNPRKYNNIE